MTDYQEEWRKFRVLRDTYVMVFGGKFLIDFGTDFVWPISARRAQFDLIVDALWGCALILLGQRLWKWKCPKCGKLFAGGAKVFDKISTCLNWVFLPRQCVSCGLTKFSLSSTGQDGVPQDSGNPRSPEGTIDS